MALNGSEKAAIFLTSIGEEIASEVLKGMDIKDIGKISMYMTRLKSKDKKATEEVFNEIFDNVVMRGLLFRIWVSLCIKMLFRRHIPSPII